MSSMKMNLGLRDDEDPPLPFEGVDKSTVIQESKVFNSSTLDTRKCKLILIKMLYLLAQGETLLQSEATDLFFNTTKLLQSNDATLRRLVYIMVKELSGVAEHVFVASNTLCKDMNSDNDMYKANSIRALRKITDTSMLGPMERYLKQAVVDRADNVSSAAIVTGLHLSSSLPELVKRWSGEVGEALKQRGVMVQYHAVALLHKLRKSDKLSVSKLVQSVNSTPIRSPLALCLLIRMCRDILQEDYDNSPDLVQFVASSIKHSSEMVVFEAAKCICSLKNISSKELTSAIMVLQLYLTSHKPVLRFAAVRLLNRVATTHPLAVTTCNVDVESLITDSNRNIATLAITTLLKTGSEFSIDRLMKQINTFMSDIADEFKIVVIDAMRVLCVKFPHKYTALLGFLSEALREEGGFDFKRSIVDAIIGVIETNPSAKEDGLLHLCEFIEDCEFTLLSQRVLHLLGQLGPTTSNPHKYIRYIYNRVMLETPAVRAASVSALAKFAAYCPPLRQSVRVLLQRVVQDNDDEVRDRAVFYSKVLEGSEEDIQRFIVDVANAALTVKRKQAPATIELPRVELEGGGGQAGGDATNSDGTGGGVGGAQLESAHERAQRVAVERAVREMTENPRLRAYGQPHFTTAPEHLTDTDTEYVVTYLKHSYPDRVVLQFRVHCNLDDVVLDNVSVKMDVSRVEGVEEEFSLPAVRIRSGETTSCYVVLQRDPTMYPTGSIANVLSFAMKEVDKETGEPESVGTEDEYQLEEVVLNVCDYMQPLHVVNFHKDWEEVGELEQLAETYSLASMKTLQAAADAVVGFLGMEPHGNCRQVPAKAKSHQLLLAGVLCTDPPSKLLVKAKVFFSQENSVALDFAIRGADDETRNFLVQELMS